MTENDIIQKINMILKEVLNKEIELKASSNLDDTLLDNLDILEFYMRLEDEFDMVIPDGEYFETVDAIVNYVMALKQ